MGKCDCKKSPNIFGKENRQFSFAKGLNFYKLFWIFLITSFAGDLIETLFCYVTTGRLMSRSSVIYGTFSIVWGLGAVLLTILLHRLKGSNSRKIFFSAMLFGAIYEYLCSLVQEIVLGVKFWDYSAIPLNWQGRINLIFCVYWGILSVIWIKGVYPYLSKKIENIPSGIGKPLSALLVLLMVGNMFISAVAITRTVERNNDIPASSKLSVFLDSEYPDEMIIKIYPNMRFIKK